MEILILGGTIFVGRGVAEAANLAEAYELALRCDPVSAFGGIVALNRKLDAKAAALIVKIFTEVIIAPEADDAAIAIVAANAFLFMLEDSLLVVNCGAVFPTPSSSSAST